MVVTVFSIHLFRAEGDRDRSPTMARVGIIGLVFVIFNSTALKLTSILQFMGFYRLFKVAKNTIKLINTVVTNTQLSSTFRTMLYFNCRTELF
jgi:hypothetical protein